MLPSMVDSMVAKRFARAVASRQGGQTALILLALPVATSHLPLHEDLAGPVRSHVSSAVSSASTPSARFLWQPRTHSIALPKFFATDCSHLAALPSIGMDPVSSPPKGIPAAAMVAETRLAAAATPTGVRYRVIRSIP